MCVLTTLPKGLAANEQILQPGYQDPSSLLMDFQGYSALLMSDRNALSLLHREEWPKNLA